MAHAYRTTPEDTTQMPSGIPYIVGNEAAERFSYYGMTGILMTFMTMHLVNSQGQAARMNEAEASAVIHYFKAANYFFPFVGAVIADALTGKYLMIVSLSLVYCLGHAVLFLMDMPVGIEPKHLLYMGLGLIAVGAGGIKSCVSAHVGDQFGEKNQHLLEKVYMWFYFAINVGAGVSLYLCPELLDRYGAGVAFGVPGFLMAAATLVFWLGRNRYAHIPASRERFVRSLDREGLLAVARIVPLYLFVAVFWALFDQSSSRWIDQAEKMNRTLISIPTGGAEPWTFTIKAAQTQAANAIFVLLLIPLFSLVVYPAINKVWRLTPLRKIGLGLFVMVPVFVISAWIQSRIDGGATPHIYWQLLAYAVLTSAEVLVSITALEFSYTQAPTALKSLVMGVNMLSVTLGNLFVGGINDYIAKMRASGQTVLEGATYYWFFAGCMAAAAVVYVPWALTYRGRSQMQTEAPPPAAT